MTTKWNKAGLLQAAAVDGSAAAPRPRPVSSVIRAPLGPDSGTDRIAGLDTWLAASLAGDLFTTRFLWASDCGSLRFAALGETVRVAYQRLGAALRESADKLNLPDDLAARLPLGLFVLGATDARPGAFDRGETETRARCWIPRVLLMQDGNGMRVFCADDALRHAVLRRLAKWEYAEHDARVQLGLPGCSPSLLETPADCRETWWERVAEALAHIERGDLEKVVVSRRLVFEPAAGTFSPAASSARVGNADGRTGFSISTDAGRSCFIAATPETLLRVRDKHLTTHALAGTLPAGASLEEFLASGKLTREHAFVTDGMVSNLAPYVRNMRPGALRVRRSGSVTHLETPLEGDLRGGADPLDILSALHPTAAIGGWPRQEAIQALRRIEPYCRGWFAAPVGWMAANGDMHATIAIRSLWVSRERAVALAGAGVVEGSASEDEWLETENKFDNMRAAIRGQIIGD